MIMERESISFSTDIKKYEETLAKDPKSFCFAPLSDLYRKNGLLDEAITVAKTGCEMHPGYVGGFMALGRAYFEKGEKIESIAALERVIQVTPDNHLAQKLLSQLYTETGDAVSAVRSLRSILSTNPNDAESQLLLDSLKSDNIGFEDSLPNDLESFFSADTNEIMDESTLEYELALDDAEVIEELTEISELEDEVTGVTEEKTSEDIERKDPLKTATLAELYVSQGVLPSALSIYQELLKDEPENPDYRKRVAEIQQALAPQVPQEAPAEAIYFLEDSTEDIYAETISTSTGPEADAIGKLEKWLENIKRGR